MIRGNRHYVPTGKGLFLRPRQIVLQEEAAMSTQETERQHGDKQQNDEFVSPPDPVHKEGDRQVGDDGEEQGSEEPRGSSDSDRAEREQQDSIESGRETPA